MAKKKAKKRAKPRPRTVVRWLTRDGRQYASVELWEERPRYEHRVYDTDKARIERICDKTAKRILGYTLKPGEKCKVTIERLK